MSTWAKLPAVELRRSVDVPALPFAASSGYVSAAHGFEVDEGMMRGWMSRDSFHATCVLVLSAVVWFVSSATIELLMRGS
jgi:hypothetical protein